MWGEESLVEGKIGADGTGGPKLGESWWRGRGGKSGPFGLGVSCQTYVSGSKLRKYGERTSAFAVRFPEGLRP